MQTFADFLHHIGVFRRVGVRIERQFLFRFVAFQVGNHPAGNQIHFRLGTGEVEVFATIQKRRAGKADVHFFCPAVIKKLGRFAHLRTAHQRVVNQKQTLVANERVHGNKLHMRN